MKHILFIGLFIVMGCETQQKDLPNPHHPEKKIVLEGLNHPWSIAFLSEQEALISEKDGNLVKANLASKTKSVIKGFPTDLTDSIRAYSMGDNSGIFEVLLDPDFKKNQWVYFAYAAKRKGEGRTTKVVRAQLQNDSLINHQTLLVAEPFAREYFHFGGGMLFGADGKLFITVGERLYWERDNPPLPNAQNPKDKRGKIYRINPDGSIPEDNPDFGKGAIPGIYAMGIRAAQGLAIEPNSKKIWFSEHGTIQGDEINILTGGANYGWPNLTSGKLRSPNYKPPKLPGVSFTPPVWFWPHTVAPTGLTFYTGEDFPDWKNNLLVPGLSRGSLWRFRIENDTVKSAEELFTNDRVRIRKVRQSPEGKLYILTDEDDGKLIQIIPKYYSNS